MRYNIMLQLVVGTTLILLGSAALFAWIQTRPEPVEMNQKNKFGTAMPLSARSSRQF